MFNYKFQTQKSTRILNIIYSQTLSISLPTSYDGNCVEYMVHQAIQSMPKFPGGETALRKFLADNIRYPTLAQENGIQGKVVIEFIIGKDGGVYDIQVSRSVEESLDKEALRVVNLMPKWIPGKKNGKTVKVKYFLPIMFRFQ